MEHQRLTHSPIVEAVCEFRFAPEAAWDWTVPGLLAPALRTDYPGRKEVAPNILTIGAPPDTDPPFPPARIQFVSADELSMVQSGPRMLAVNHLSPYPGWETFSSQILRALDAHTENCGWQPLQRIGLLYINRFESDEPADQVLSVAPRTEALPEGVTLSKFAQQWELAFDHSGLILTTTRVTDPSGFVVQLDAFTTLADHVRDRSSVVSWLEHAHETVYQVFARSLTPPTFERLKR